MAQHSVKNLTLKFKVTFLLIFSETDHQVFLFKNEIATVVCLANSQWQLYSGQTWD